MTEAEAIEAAVNAALPIPGWMTDQELRHLATRARACRAVLEIGSWQGRSTRCIATALPPGGVVYAIDTWQGEQATPMDAHELRSAFMRHLLPEIMTGRVIQYTIRSAAFAHMLKVGWIDCISAFDLIFIDGSHDRDSVIEDITAFRPYVKPGRFLAGHDYQLPGVQQALAAVLPDARCVAGSIWEFVVPG